MAPLEPSSKCGWGTHHCASHLSHTWTHGKPTRLLLDRPNGLLYIQGALKISSRSIWRIFSVDCKSTPLVYFEKGGSCSHHYSATFVLKWIQSVKTRWFETNSNHLLRTYFKNLKHWRLLFVFWLTRGDVEVSLHFVHVIDSSLQYAYLHIHF